MTLASSRMDQGYYVTAQSRYSFDILLMSRESLYNRPIISNEDVISLVVFPPVSDPLTSSLWALVHLSEPALRLSERDLAKLT
jgi:hypothetical protein